MAHRTHLAWLRLTLLALGLLLQPLGAASASGPAPAIPALGARHAAAGEVPSPFYDSILYAEIGPKLKEIEAHSRRVRVEVIGHSAGGHDLYLVTLAAPSALARLGELRALRSAEPADPATAGQAGDLPVPVLINAGIHGDEYPAVDAAMRLIERLAFDDGAEAQQVLASQVLLINVVANPDGRVLGRRENAAGFDLSRDLLTQSQPEVQALVRVISAWSPMLVLDLHGFTSPMLIEACLPPYDGGSEDELYATWALRQAEAMRAEVLAQTGMRAQASLRSRPDGCDDWPPISLPSYATYHGAFAHTLEAGDEDERGVVALYAAVWGACRFVAENRGALARLFAGGSRSVPPAATAYIIPAGPPLQESPHEAARLVDLLLQSGVQVEESSEPVMAGGATYPAGSYVVWMEQPRRALAHALLATGQEGAWGLPLLWGVSLAPLHGPLALETRPITRARVVAGQVEEGPAAAYAYLPTSTEAIRATNELLDRGEAVYRIGAPMREGERELGAGTFVLPAADGDARAAARDLAERYGLTLHALPAIPAGATPLRRPRLLASAGEGVSWALRTMGFEVMPVTARQINAGRSLSGYDVLVVSGDGDFWRALSREAQQAAREFLAAGHGLVGIGHSGARLNEGAGLLDAGWSSGDYCHTAILRLRAGPADAITAGYPPASHGLARYPLWFTRTGPGVAVSATIAEREFLASGSWPGWQESGAAGMPVVVHGKASVTPVVLMGIDPAFRARPALTFRLLANAIYSVME